MIKRNYAYIAATLVSIIYGVTFTVAKDVMPQFVMPYGFILLRVAGSTLLFWSISFIGPKEKIETKDFPRIAAAALFGVALNMLTFFKGLSYTSPIMGAVLMCTTPLIVLVFSAILLREQMSTQKIIGLVLGLIGTAVLILYGKSMQNAPHASLGNLLVFINAISYGFYLIIVKKLMNKYNAFTFVKWIYTFGFLLVLPFGWHEFQAIAWPLIPLGIYYKIGFIVVFSTFLTYLLNLVSMRELKPTTIAVFIYLQPLFASVFAIGLGKDALSGIKILAAALIFTGVYLVTQSNAAKPKSKPIA
jgi:drug/metabolite transporter (DMT)-like permease